ncbi:hypothetical protein SAMN05421809_3122 [Natronorubrum daqingense]|uniref:Uncharacterized protein n=1 Tax=Natronorubrum daqingense TaxID=588898 RepID=A0A1N7F9L3_9EURY|nr:hypothetical protein SAMN05421809_3122 [Natronorubrum daqingense]
MQGSPKRHETANEVRRLAPLARVIVIDIVGSLGTSTF